jgi:uncharacterized protein YoaH (UPF0181 family)
MSGQAVDWVAEEIRIRQKSAKFFSDESAESGQPRRLLS